MGKVPSVIQCPYCRAPLTETTAACPKCSLDLERANAVMGPVPRLHPEGVTDFATVLSSAPQRRIEKAISTFQDRFPQSAMAVVIRRFSADFPIGVHLFWLFNGGVPSSEARKRGNNRDILIGIDPARGTAGLTVGYGLEPFLGQEALDHIMHLALPHLGAGDYASGALDIISGLSRLMEGICRDLGEAVGLDDDFAVKETTGEY